METLVIILLSVIVGLLSYSVYTLYKKVMFFEDEFLKIEEGINSTIDMMTQIDIGGAFEADDEVGDVFNQMKRLVDNLGEYIYAEEKEKV